MGLVGGMPLGIVSADIEAGRLVILDLEKRTGRNRRMPMQLFIGSTGHRDLPHIG